MDTNEIKNKCYDIVADVLGLNESDLFPNANFIVDLGADSLDAVDIIIKTENAFDIALQEGEADNIKILEDYINLVIDKVNKTAGTS